MHRCVAQPEFDNRAELGKEARIRRAAGGRGLGGDAGHFLYHRGQCFAELAWRGQKGLARDHRLQRAATRLDNAADQLDQALAAVQIVEADGQPRQRLCRDHIRCRVAGVQLSNLDIARLEKFGAFIEYNRLDLRKDGNQPRNWIVGQMRIGNMALRAFDGDPHIHRSAPTDLHHVAQPVDAGGFADKAQIGQGAACLHMLDQRACAVDGWAFLITGDDQAYRSGFFGDFVQGSDKGPDAAFHVDSAAPVKQVAADFGFEWCACPAVARRHDIKMPRKGEMPPAFSTDCKQVFHRAAMRRVRIVSTCNETFDSEAQRHQQRLHRVKNAAARRRDALAGHQGLGILQGKAVSHLHRMAMTLWFVHKFWLEAPCPRSISKPSRNRTRPVTPNLSTRLLKAAGGVGSPLLRD